MFNDRREVWRRPQIEFAGSTIISRSERNNIASRNEYLHHDGGSRGSGAEWVFKPRCCDRNGSVQDGRGTRRSSMVGRSNVPRLTWWPFSLLIWHRRSVPSEVGAKISRHFRVNTVAGVAPRSWGRRTMRLLDLAKFSGWPSRMHSVGHASGIQQKFRDAMQFLPRSVSSPCREIGSWGESLRLAIVWRLSRTLRTCPIWLG